MTNCRNPECVGGKTPGVVVIGRGKELVGQKMNWTWVRCPACQGTADDRKAGAVFKQVSRSDAEMLQRAELATHKAPYKQESNLAGLARVKQKAAAGTNGHTLRPNPPANDARLDEMLEKISKLTDTVNELLQENRELRKQAESVTKPIATPAKPS